MTNRERLLSLLGFAPSNADVLDGELLDFGITASDTYVATSSLEIKKCAVQVMQLLLSTADTTNENGYAIKYDRAAVLKRLELLQVEIEGEAAPTITSPKVW